MAPWTDGFCSNCGSMMTTGGCPSCARPTLIVTVTSHTEYADPRDAEIARLKAQIDEDNRVILAVREHNRQLRAALAAGPAALRRKSPADELPGVWDLIADAVEAAQAAALKDGT